MVQCAFSGLFAPSRFRVLLVGDIPPSASLFSTSTVWAHPCPAMFIRKFSPICNGVRGELGSGPHVFAVSVAVFPPLCCAVADLTMADHPAALPVSGAASGGAAAEAAQVHTYSTPLTELLSSLPCVLLLSYTGTALTPSGCRALRGTDSAFWRRLRRSHQQPGRYTTAVVRPPRETHRRRCCVVVFIHAHVAHGCAAAFPRCR